MLASASLMTLDHREHHLESIRAALSVVVYPLQYTLNLPVSAGEWIAETVSSRQALLDENRKLREQHLLLKARLQKHAALEAENMRLRDLLESSFKVGERVLIAEIMAVDMDPFTRQIVINKGAQHEIYAGQPILDADGIMGQILHVGPISSTAMLITDPSHALPVQVNRNGLRAIAIGTGSLNRLELPHIPNNADIKEGDLLVTSGLGGRFPPGYPVAKVVHIQRDTGNRFAQVLAAPTAQLERSREVLLAWPARLQAAQETAPEATAPTP